MRADVQLILLASLSLIPNNTLRYTALGSIIALALVYHIHLNIATWLRQLERSIQQTEEFIEEVKTKCPWPGDQFKLAEERARLLEVKRAASEMHCSVLAAGKPTWKEYWFLKRSVAECANRVKNIRTAVQRAKFSEDLLKT
ncbi:hypothetical protein DFH08DRAFT_799206 [Mycena albidolilacea]|uniref:Uncharacterized protein n=1 Tax=Mycena albidolilacea TaxID=1033008 RepID=A0AAD7AQI5_9AGAR|nr:hypothetical protein DFH08DRAFT_799206 [Mycena albidolilacea]